ncbi:hypothetical protein N7527_007315 [Penicillium freii]|nr:hypothetical protein N7527_007315 [Penicillium freii]
MGIRATSTLPSNRKPSSPLFLHKFLVWVWCLFSVLFFGVVPVCLLQLSDARFSTEDPIDSTVQPTLDQQSGVQ